MRHKKWIALTLAINSLIATGSALSQSKIAIVDVAFDTRPFLDRLVENDVLVIGRYYSRCTQPELGLTQKRLIDQGLPSNPESEIAQISQRGLAVLSIYQYYNNSANKFRGRSKSGRILRNEGCNWTSVARSTEEEARLDVEAAIKQARDVGQPEGTAIYFGVDFNFTEADTQTRQRMISYFRVIKEKLVAANFKVGAYGSGLAHRILRSATDNDGNVGLIDYSWISASRSFAETSAFHRSGKWHLFQNQVDKEWFGIPQTGGGCKRGLALDTNVQNPAQDSEIGFWKTNGSFSVPTSRSSAIYDSRKFACDGNAILRRTRSSPSSDITNKRVCVGGAHVRVGRRIDFANAARLGETHNNLIQIDVDDDGSYDGWTWKGNISTNFGEKPDWIFSTSARRNKKCE